ncbi:MAG TPA: NADPH-dependent assimilatory sulfite reductase hemoprotein subunit [Candidatus Acidoferrales bacterium]|nr:NADPH-dependent assimilatory sulfite reductase hemoprotein subunit [Candidatus Acidoferrales bacterium]
MCATCGCHEAPDSGTPLSKVEVFKGQSRGLRGTVAEELAEPTPVFSDGAVQVLKFHGIYQQDDRDRRKEARSRGLDKHHQMMVRTRIPGGVASAAAYLAHDHIAEVWGNSTMRITTRQDFQLHAVLKSDLKRAIQAINAGLLTTLGGCGDQERNIMSCPSPHRDRLREDLAPVLDGLAAALAPVTHAYHEIWLDGELACSSGPDLEPDPLYGSQYLPRKFKTGLAPEGDNCIDVYANDLGLVARRGPGGGLAGFEILVGGGFGRTNHKPDTFPSVAQPLGFVLPDQVTKLALAVVTVFRDQGNRSDRRHARLKYLIHERGLDWFKARVDALLDFPIQPSTPLKWERIDDHLGWHEQGDGHFFLGIFVENGRIADTAEHRLRSALRKIVDGFQPGVRLTAQQNLILTDLTAESRDRIDAILAAHGVLAADQLPSALRTSMACPAWPTCGLAVAESERVMPQLIRRLSQLLTELGLAQEQISFRMTGCPNGCARPYLGDVGFVGTTLGKYDVFLGGDFEGTRLNELYTTNVSLEDIPDLLRAPLEAFSHDREASEGFGQWCHRLGVDALRERFGAQPVPVAGAVPA